MRIVTYNVHSCRGLDRRLDPNRIARAIASTAAEVACLQELDFGRPRTGRVHQAQEIAQALEMQFHFHPAMRIDAEEYGDAILSLHPQRVIHTGELPHPRFTEPRGVLWVEIEADGTCWQVLNTHFGLGRKERRDQARAFAEWVKMALEKPPVIVCGDLNSRPQSTVHTLLRSGMRDVQVDRGSHQKTFPTRFPLLCLDYIYVSSDVEVVASQVIANAFTRIASDHLPLVAELRAR